jgi:hypothetical protein
MRPNIGVLRSAIGPMLTETGTISSLEWVKVDGLDVEVLVTKFNGPCLVRPEGEIQTVAVGGVERPILSYDVTFPADADVSLGDVLVLDDVPFDPALSGASINLTDVPLDSWAVARFCKGKRAPA